MQGPAYVCVTHMYINHMKNTYLIFSTFLSLVTKKKLRNLSQHHTIRTKQHPHTYTTVYFNLL